MVNKRKALTKKIRFEVFKRDHFTCQYCGNVPPTVILEVDHINPVSNGGDNNIDNLATSCFDCNRGKTNIPLESIPDTLEKKRLALEEKETQIREYNKILKRMKSRETRSINEVHGVFKDHFSGYTLKKEFKESVRTFIRKLPKDEVVISMRIACTRIDKPENAALYFCGICWRKIKQNGVNDL